MTTTPVVNGGRLFQTLQPAVRTGLLHALRDRLHQWQRVLTKLEDSSLDHAATQTTDVAPLECVDGLLALMRFLCIQCISCQDQEKA